MPIIVSNVFWEKLFIMIFQWYLNSYYPMKGYKFVNFLIKDPKDKKCRWIFTAFDHTGASQ